MLLCKEREWTGEVAWWVTALDLSEIPGTHLKVEGESRLQKLPLNSAREPLRVTGCTPQTHTDNK